MFILSDFETRDLTGEFDALSGRFSGILILSVKQCTLNKMGLDLNKAGKFPLNLMTIDFVYY